MRRRTFLKTAAATLASAVVGGGYVASRPTDNLSRHLTPGEIKKAKQVADSEQHGLRAKEWDEIGFISKYRDVIRREAGKNGLPARFVAATICDENIGRHYIDDLADKWKLSKGKDASIEAGQVRLITAMYLDGVIPDLKPSSYLSVDDNTKAEYERRLADPEGSISYTARELARLRDIRQRQVGKNKNLNLTGTRRDYGSMALIRTWYIEGTDAKKPSARAERTMKAYDLPWMKELFPEDAIYSCLDTVVEEEDALRIKQRLGYGVTSGALPDLSYALEEANKISMSRDWGKGKEYYMSIEVVALMFSAKTQVEKGNTDGACRLYEMALQRRIQLDNAYNNGIDIPEVVGAGSSVLQVAKKEFILERYNQARLKR